MIVLSIVRFFHSGDEINGYGHLEPSDSAINGLTILENVRLRLAFFNVPLKRIFGASAKVVFH